MKFTLKWLREYLDFDCSIIELSEALTRIGLEVENVNNPYEDLKNFTICEIKKITKHPNADKLKICIVNNGREDLQIICGANNVRKNLKTVLAPVETVLPSKNQSNGMKIKKSVIRGVESFGMLCSAEELCLETDSNGIIEIDDNKKVGTSYLDCADEELITIEIAITPNRPDCAGVFGIAKDLVALGLGKFKEQDKINLEEEVSTPIKLKNNLKDSDCPQFLLRLIKNVKNKNSSEDLVKRFNATGIKVISALVDVTNFLTFDRCRPLHVFDYDKIDGDIVIRHSFDGEKFKGLDGIEYELLSGMIVICDDSGIISLAGIMGGERTSCDFDTNNVLVESAFFMPEKIAWAGRKLAIESDARYRFERGIDPNSTLTGINLASSMITKICGGKVGNVVSDGEYKKNKKNISIKASDVSKLLGYKFEMQFIKDKLRLLGCDLIEKNDIIEVNPPSWRHDLEIKEDLIEEIARLYGYENLPSTPIDDYDKLKSNITNQSQKLKKTIGRKLASEGLTELKTWSFVDIKYEKIINSSKKIIEISNPISLELSCMRSNLLINLLNALKKNIKRGFTDLAFFEIGPVFNGYQVAEQTEYIAGVRCGELVNKDWLQTNRNVDVFDVKSDIMNILLVLNFSESSLVIDNTEIPEYFHPKKTGRIKIGKQIIGFFGTINPKILKKFGLKTEVSFFELNFDAANKYFKKEKVSKKTFSVSQFQFSKRDFSFVLDKEILSSEIISTIKKVDKSLIKNVKIFDLFEGGDFGNKKKALAVEVLIQSEEKTLTDEELEKLSLNIIKKVESNCNAKLRL